MKNALNTNSSIRVSLYPAAIFTAAFDQAKADSKNDQALNPNDLPRVGYARAGYTAGLLAATKSDASADKWFSVFAGLRSANEMLSLIASLSFDHEAGDIALITGISVETISGLLDGTITPSQAFAEDLLISANPKLMEVRSQLYADAVTEYHASWVADNIPAPDMEEEEIEEEEEESEA